MRDRVCLANLVPTLGRQVPARLQVLGRFARTRKKGLPAHRSGNLWLFAFRTLPERLLPHRRTKTRMACGGPPCSLGEGLNGLLHLQDGVGEVLLEGKEGLVLLRADGGRLGGGLLVRRDVLHESLGRQVELGGLTAMYRGGPTRAATRQVMFWEGFAGVWAPVASRRRGIAKSGAKSSLRNGRSRLGFVRELGPQARCIREETDPGRPGTPQTTHRLELSSP